MTPPKIRAEGPKKNILGGFSAKKPSTARKKFRRLTPARKKNFLGGFSVKKNLYGQKKISAGLCRRKTFFGALSLVFQGVAATPQPPNFFMTPLQFFFHDPPSSILDHAHLW